MASKVTNELRDGSMDTPLSLSNRLLSQFSFAGVHPYTMNWARVSTVIYEPSTSGERIINHCLTNLPVYVAADDRLQFGWNEKFIYRNLGLHQFEYHHILLISAMSECLPEAYVAAVLSCLSDTFEDEDRIKPTVDSWTRAVRSMDGLLTTSDFAVMLDQRMRLDPYRVTSGHSISCTNSLIPPAEFAKALEALGKLSISRKGELTLVGGNFLGWFATFTELFLDVSVHISARDGQELYTTQNGRGASLRLIFLDEVDSTIVSGLETLSLTVMCAPDAEENTVPRIPFTGRVGWEGLLSKVFETSFNRIAHQDSKCFVQSVGGVARTFQLLAEDPATPEDVVSQDNRLNPASWGMGLIQTLCNWFPEMRHLQGRLERIQRLDKTGAMGKCNEGAEGLTKLCGCTICEGLPYLGPDGQWITPPATTDGPLPQSFCLLAIMETILNLALAMSRITVVPSVYPSRAGILCIYQRQVQKLLDAKGRVKSAAFDRVKALFLNDWNAGYSRRLQNATAMFSGSWPENDLPENLCALRHEGICAYVMDIQYGENSAKHRRDKDVIRVLPGHIAFKQKLYSRVTNGPPKGLKYGDYSWEEEGLDHMKRKLYFK